MIRAAIYARYSSDNQNARSVDDQNALNRETCARAGFAVVSTFDDREISGAATVNRPGFLALMRAAEARAFDVIVIEAQDRTFRDQADYHAARKRLDFLGIALHTASGPIGRLEGSLRAIIDEQVLHDLAAKTHRGLQAVVRDGRHAGGRAYGYRTIAGRAGELEIDPAEAAIVRRIFAEFCAGSSPRAIAAGLNRNRIPPPRGSRWNASTINGNAARGHGMILNALYAGEIVWNKVRMVKHPATGKRISRPNPPDQYRRSSAPHLAIVDAATWKAAQAIKAGRSHAGAAKSRRPLRPLSGLLRCGSCGAGMTSTGVTNGTARLQCSGFRESGACSNGRKVSRDAIETLVFEALSDELAHPDAIAEYVRTYNSERRRLARASGDRERHLARRDGEIGRELERLVDGIAKGRGAVDALLTRINDLEIERKTVKAELAAIGASSQIVTLHPAAVDRYLADVRKLAAVAAVHGEIDAGELVGTLRSMVEAVTVHAAPNSDELAIEIRTSLDGLVLPGPLVKSRRGGIDGSGGVFHAITPRPSTGLSYLIRRERKAA